MIIDLQIYKKANNNNNNNNNNNHSRPIKNYFEDFNLVFY
jgi:hypothetical protein